MSPAAEPLVSIVVTAYNYAATLPRAIESALAQTYPRIEVLVCDNASSDGTPELMRAYARDPRVRYIRHTRDIGSVANHNFGGDAARGDYLLFLSADDMLYPHLVRTNLDFLRAHPQIDVAHAAIALMELDGANPNAILRSGEIPGTYAGGRDELAAQLAYSGYLCMTTMLLSREIWRAHGPFARDVTAIDYDYTLRLAARGARIGYLPTIGAAIAIHGDSISGTREYLGRGGDLRDFLALLERYAFADPARVRGHEYAIMRHLGMKYDRCVLHGMPEEPATRAAVARCGDRLRALATAPASAPARFGFVLLADASYAHALPTIASLLAQTDADWTLTVVATGAFDDTELYASLDPRIRTLRLCGAASGARAANLGILRTAADAFCVLRPGARLDPSFLARTRAGFDPRDAPIVLAGRVEGAPNAPGRNDATLAPLDIAGPASASFAPEACTIARAAFDRAGFFDESLHALFCLEFLLRAGGEFGARIVDTTVTLDAHAHAHWALPDDARAIAARYPAHVRRARSFADTT